MAESKDSGKSATATTDKDVRKVVETANAEDENPKRKVTAGMDDEEEDDEPDEDGDNAGEEGDGSDEASEDEDDKIDSESDEDEAEESDDDESKPDEKKAPKEGKFRFTQFAGDGKPETYIANLEKAYNETSAEGVRLNQQLGQKTRQIDAIMQAAAKDSALAEKLHAAITGTDSDAGDGGATRSKPSPTDNPFLVNAQTNWKEQSEKEAQEFIEANPEVMSDPKINSDVKKWMEHFSRIEYEETGKLITAGEAMGMAYRHLGLDDKRQKEEVANGVKKLATPTRPQSSKKNKVSTKSFTDSQLAFAQAMNVSPDKLEKYAK